MLRGLLVFYSPKCDQLHLFDEQGRHYNILVDQCKNQCLNAAKGSSIFTRGRKNKLPKHFQYIGRYDK